MARRGPKKKRPGERLTVQISFRIDAETAADFDALRGDLHRLNPGAVFSEASVARALFIRGLAILQQELERFE